MGKRHPVRALLIPPAGRRIATRRPPSPTTAVSQVSASGHLVPGLPATGGPPICPLRRGSVHAAVRLEAQDTGWLSLASASPQQ
jgi:hypothetical protein